MQADVDTRSVIQYIIEGIQDDAVNKIILHGAKTIHEFKKRFTQYEDLLNKKREIKDKIIEAEKRKENNSRRQIRQK